MCDDNDHDDNNGGNNKILMLRSTQIIKIILKCYKHEAKISTQEERRKENRIGRRNKSKQK